MRTLARMRHMAALSRQLAHVAAIAKARDGAKSMSFPKTPSLSPNFPSKYDPNPLIPLASHQSSTLLLSSMAAELKRPLRGSKDWIELLELRVTRAYCVDGKTVAKMKGTVQTKNF